MDTTEPTRDAIMWQLSYAAMCRRQAATCEYDRHHWISQTRTAIAFAAKYRTLHALWRTIARLPR